MTSEERKELAKSVSELVKKYSTDHEKRQTVYLAGILDVLLSIDERMEKTEKMAAQFDKVSSGGNAMMAEAS